MRFVHGIAPFGWMVVIPVTVRPICSAPYYIGKIPALLIQQLDESAAEEETNLDSRRTVGRRGKNKHTRIRAESRNTVVADDARWVPVRTGWHDFGPEFHQDFGADFAGQAGKIPIFGIANAAVKRQLLPDVRLSN